MERGGPSIWPIDVGSIGVGSSAGSSFLIDSFSCFVAFVISWS
jgi:hypothetical protein